MMFGSKDSEIRSLRRRNEHQRKLIEEMERTTKYMRGEIRQLSNDNAHLYELVAHLANNGGCMPLMGEVMQYPQGKYGPVDWPV